MTEKNEAATLPETGPDSPAGLRYFVSCRYPRLNVTIEPAEMKTDTKAAKNGTYAIFRSTGKPNDLQGVGERIRGREHEGDRNSPRTWGIFGPIMDPGPEPDGGWKDDPRTDEDGKKFKNRMTAEKKRLNRKTIDHLRTMDLYEKTRQDNKVSDDSLLVELNWDPTPFSGSVAGTVTRGRPSIGKDGLNDSNSPEVAPPAETRAPVEAAAKVPSLGRGGKK